MLFNSIEFFIFLPIVFAIYWVVGAKNLVRRNVILLVASYFFYGWWDWRFLLLIAFSSIVDYLMGLSIHKATTTKKRKIYLIVSLVVNIGILGFCKYFNFFVESFENAFTLFGQTFESSRLNIILPVGISFYTFQTLSYSIDIYRKKLEPTKNIISFFAFVSFFPQLVAGPIERAKHLLPQFDILHKTDNQTFVTALHFILWGLFKKVVVADNLANYINEVYTNPSSFGSITSIVATFFFALQIYCDFSGYSNIAIGTAKLFGFDLMQNFNAPYYSRSIKEFWSKWHISLSTWFRDYVYIPLGGNMCSTRRWIINIIITFTVSGLWHGANWTFIIWGGIHGLAYIIEFYLFNNSYSKVQKFLNAVYTTFVVLMAWIFFRAESLGDAMIIINKIFSVSTNPFQLITSSFEFALCVYGILIVMLFDGLKKFTIIKNAFGKRSLRWLFYYFIIFNIILFGKTSGSEFIYFQF